MGALAIVLLFGGLLVCSLFRPWIGVFGYLFFAVLCPQWNWQWSLPDWNFQKYLAGVSLLSFLVSGMQYQRLPRWGVVSVVCLTATLVLNLISGMDSISPSKSEFFIGIFWKITLMTILASGVLSSLRILRLTAVALAIAQGWNAFNVNQRYFQLGYIDLSYFEWNFLDSNTYSISTLPILAIAVGLLFSDGSHWVRLLSCVIIALQLHQLMILESRGTMIGAIVLGALSVTVMPKSSFNLKAVGVGLLMVVVLAGPPVVREFSSIFVSQDERDSSADSRFYVWDAGLRISLDNPLLGVGPWAGEALVPSYYRGEIGDVEGKALHNLFFEMSTGAGIPALILYVLFFAAVFIGHFQLWRSGKWMPSELRTINIAVLCGVPGYLVASVFSSGILIESPYVLVSLGIASVASHGAMCATDIPGLRAESLNADSILSAG